MKKAFIALEPLLPFALYIGIGVAVIFGGIWGYKKLLAQFGAGAPDPGGGRASTSILDGMLNQTLEVGKSSMTYTDAASQVALHPYDSFKAILGWN